MLGVTLTADALFVYSLTCTIIAVAESSRCLTPIIAAERILDAARIVLISLVLGTAIVTHIARRSLSRPMRWFSFIVWGFGTAMLIIERLLWMQKG